MSVSRSNGEENRQNRLRQAALEFFQASAGFFSFACCRRVKLKGGNNGEFYFLGPF